MNSNEYAHTDMKSRNHYIPYFFILALRLRIVSSSAPSEIEIAIAQQFECKILFV